MGRHRIIPPYAVQPYTEDHADMWMGCLFCLGYGPILIDELKIGEVAIEQFDDIEVDMVFGFENDPVIQIEMDGGSEAASQVRGTDYSILLEEDEPVIRTTAADTDRITVDLHWPRGLVLISEEGEYEKAEVRVRFEYAPVGTNRWQPGTDPELNGSGDAKIKKNDTRPLVKSWTWKVPRGQYDVRVTRLNSNDDDGGTLFDETYLIKLTSYRYDPPVRKRSMAMVALAIRASEQLNGVIDEFNCVAWSCLPDLGAYELRFDGFGEHLKGLHGAGTGDRPHPNVTGAGARTYEWWMLVETDIAESAGVFEDGFGNGNGRDFCFRLVAKAESRWAVDVGGTLYDFTVAGSVDGQWHQWAVRYDGLALIVFFDGVNVANWPAVVLDTAPDRMRVAEVDGSRFRGRIRDLRKWSIARDEASIAADRHARLTGTEEGLVSLYPMDEGRGGWCLDHGPRRNHLQHVASPSWHDVSATTPPTWGLRPTSNPASIFREILQGSANRNPVPDSRLDLANLEDWHGWNVQQGNAFNMVLDFPSTVFERLRHVSSVGLASLAMPDGRYGVVIDRPQGTVVQHFTPRNSWGFVGRRVFRETPTALRIRFVDETNNWQQDELTVYDDGHDATTENIYEQLDLPGITNPEQVWRHGRHHLAVAKLRPETYEITVDVENLACTRGDLVRVTHDIMLVGLGWGRIKSLALDGENRIVALELDEELAMEAGKTYQLTIRGADGSSYTHTLATEEGRWNVLRLTAPTADPIGVGDLAMFGESGRVTSGMVVKSIEHHDDLSARLTLVDESPAIYSAHTGPIPERDPGITLPPDEQRTPAPPTILRIVTDESALLRDGDGAFIVRAMLELHFAAGRFAPPDRMQVQHRLFGTDTAWESSGWLPIEGRVVYVRDIEERRYYEFRVRSVSRLGQVSAWSAPHAAYVIGKTSPPPRVEGLRAESLPGGMRKITWSLANQPPDYRGVRLRYGAGSGLTWEEMTDLGESLFQTPVETPRPLASGGFTIGARAVDYSGNLSEEATRIDVRLGNPPLGGIDRFISAREAGWPGVITGPAFVRGGVLHAGWEMTWEGLETALTTWDDIEAMDQAWGASGFSYEHPGDVKSGEWLDLGRVMTFMPVCGYETRGYAEGSIPKINFDLLIQLEERHSMDGAAWSNWAETGSQAVTARYIVFRITLAHQVADELRDFTMSLRATPTQEHLAAIDTAALTGSLRLGIGDIRLPLGRPLKTVTSVIVSFGGAGGGWTWELVDKAASPGPRVRFYQNGAPADTTLDAIVFGFE